MDTSFPASCLEVHVEHTWRFMGTISSSSRRRRRRRRRRSSSSITINTITITSTSTVMVGAIVNTISTMIFLVLNKVPQ